MNIDIIDHRKDLQYAIQVTNSWRDSSGEVLVEEIGYEFLPVYTIPVEEKIKSCKARLDSAKKIHSYQSDNIEVVKDLPEEFEFNYKENWYSDIYAKEIETHHFINYKIVKVKIIDME